MAHIVVHDITTDTVSASSGGPAEGDTTCPGVPAGGATDDITDDYAEVKAQPTEVIYVKENVWVWPSRSARIMGRLTLTRQHRVIFLSWLPYCNGTVNQDGTFRSQGAERPCSTDGTPGGASQRTRYAIRPAPITEIEAITKHTPAIGCHYMVLVMRSGVVHAPLYFQNGGIKALMGLLKEHVVLTKSLADPNTYLVHDAGGPVTPQLLVDVEDVMMGAPPKASDSTLAPEAWEADGSARTCRWESEEHDSAWMARSLLTLQAVEQFADRSLRRLGRALFPDTADFALQIEQEFSMNTAMRDLVENGPLLRARRLLATNRLGRLADAQVAAEEEELSERRSMSADLRQATTDVGVFEIIEQCAPQSSRVCAHVAPPLDAHEWASFLDDEGRITERPALWRRIYAGGIAPDLRREVWKFLLGVYPADSTAAERERILAELRAEYRSISAQWQSITSSQAARWARWRERRSQIDKDVARSDRDVPDFAAPDSPALAMMQRILLSYVMYNQDLGYSQGMSDLLAPLLVIMPAEEEAFWCFVHLMDRCGGNFDSDQRCCQLQLAAMRQLVQLVDPPLHEAIKAAGCKDFLFCFRWMMVLLKREFPFAEVPRLWEVLWTNPFTPHFHIYVAVAMLEHRRQAVLEDGLDYGRMHQLCSTMRGDLDLTAVLSDAEALCKYAADAGLMCLAEVPVAVLPPGAEGA